MDCGTHNFKAQINCVSHFVYNANLEQHFSMHIGPTIKKIRLRKGIKQKDLAAKLGEYDPGNLSKIEKGVMGYSVPFLENLPAALGVPLSEIYKEAESGNGSIPTKETRDKDVHVPAESHRRLARLVELWAYLTDDTQNYVLERMEEIVHAATHGLKPPPVRLQSVRKTKTKRGVKDHRI